ncbi:MULTISPECIES: phosphatidate cytidylyltransferase [unclassified Aureimonas]|uniref:phosphatidate cytidylyltransferase n=1 Tax=unclassified Aureimonas TaxID=2615206 RepID=UPI0006FBFBE6|nr:MULTISPECIES: phosphatidate cytidylyltransferase [unclassified Aureimonas]KQT60650.1 phosphatidate cytidylyltransferase [Aureimonas sp. Leaf460]KQT68779.1 phosphatidate cytidylyltransferase [Aureimonas sp. Leaf427]
MDRTTLTLFLGIGAILLVASLVGAVLKRRTTSEAGRATVENLNQRVKAWWLMVAIFGAAFAFGQTVTLVLFALTSFYCLREFITLTPTRPADHRSVAAAFYVFIPLQYYLVGIDWLSLFSIAIPVYAFLILPMLSVMAGETQNFLQRTAKIQWGLMLTVYCISHAPALLMLDLPGFEGRNFLLLFFLITVVQLSDVLQYVFGKLFGRRKVAPNVSPSKTWEGLIGGAFSATAIGAGLFWITPFSPLQAGALAFAIVVAGFFGGLVLSAIKRSLGAKDWGTMIEGHGGALDRMDSVTYAAPIFFHLVNYFFVP